MLFLLVYITTLALLSFQENSRSAHPLPQLGHCLAFKHVNMNPATSLAEQLDPIAPLSSTDLARLLIEYCNNRIAESAKYERDATHEIIKLERDAMHDSIQYVIKSLGGCIATLRSTSESTQAETGANLKLEMQTFCSYLMELQHSLEKNVLDLSSDFKKHMKSHHTEKEFQCDLCEFSTKSVCDLVQHITYNHPQSCPVPEHESTNLQECQNSPCYSCYLCGSMFFTYNNLAVHERNHNLIQPSLAPTCGVCANRPPFNESSQVHPAAEHVESNPYYTFCWESFPSNSQTNHHLQEYHANMTLNAGNTNHVNHIISETPHNHAETDLSVPWIVCDKCGYLFTAIEDYTRHRNIEHIPSTTQIHCTLCDSNFVDMRSLNVHMATHHEVNAAPVQSPTACHPSPAIPPICGTCGKAFSSSDDLERHLCSHHDQSLDTINSSNNSVYGSEDLPTINYIQESPQVYTCHECESTFNTSMELVSHMENEHEHNAAGLDSRSVSFQRLGEACDVQDCISPIPQVDGNMSLSTLSDPDPATVSVFQSDMATSSQTHRGLQYEYELNSVNQTRRLFENSKRSPFEIRYSNPKTIKGITYHTSVSIDCNAGIYLSAVKPALERISPGWQQEVLNTSIICDSICPRNDISGRLVCTKLIMYLTENNTPQKKDKIVVHFYHTSNSIQVQGSHVMSTGESSPVWFSLHFLQPLANHHQNQHGDIIDSINDQIQQITEHPCGTCKEPIRPHSSKPKDQELSCCRCKNFFHKRCTDRRGSTANWRRKPWYCAVCISGRSPTDHDHHSTVQADLIPPQLNSTVNLDTSVSLPAITVPTTIPVSQHSVGPSPAITVTSATAQDITTSSSTASTSSSTISTNSSTISTSSPALSPPISRRAITNLTSVAQQSVPASQLGVAPVHSTISISGISSAITNIVTSTVHSSTQPGPVVNPGPVLQNFHPRFPSTNTRQRSSNIVVENPEIEFLKTALSSCRSTISQQEMELRRLKETLEIRNRRICNLETQVGQASDIIADRAPPSQHNQNCCNKLEDLKNKIDIVSMKLENFQATQPSHSFVINSCHQNTSNLKQHSSTQTNLAGDICHQVETDLTCAAHSQSPPVQSLPSQDSSARPLL